MKVLWITNIVLPEAMRLLTGTGDLKGSGGWLTGSAEQLSTIDGISLIVASVSPIVANLTYLKGNKINYYILPKRKKGLKYESALEGYWHIIYKKEAPDIIHIHGTEFPYGLAYVNACGNKKVVVSIQGMPTEISKYCDGGLGKWNIIKNITLRDIVMRNSILSVVSDMKRSAGYENALLNKVNFAIGRTSWDRVHSLVINPRLTYYSCNESLRDTFYDGKIWNQNECKPYSIFVSQLHTPLKGFHVLLKALPMVVKRFPEVQVRVAGWNIIRGNSLKDKVKLSGYGRILRKLIYGSKLSDSIVLLGQLNAEEMKAEMLKSNVYICPSSIENSPNSLGEAQLLGVPCIASYVGGIPDFIPNEKCGRLYRFEDEAMLADIICQVFSQTSFDNSFMRQIASTRHDRTKNVNTLLNIYKQIARS